MVTLLIILLAFDLLVMVHIFNTKAGMKYNSVSVMIYLWIVLMVMSSIFGEHIGFYPLDVSCVFFAFLFLTVILFTANAVIVKKDHCIEKQTDSIASIDEIVIYKVSVAFFLLYIGSNCFYFINLGKYIPISNLLGNLWKWKNLVLTGTFSENSILYIGRNLGFIGLILSINFIKNKSSNKILRRMVSIVMLLTYIAITFLNPRRDPMIDKVIYVAVPFIYIYRKETKKLLKIAVPIAFFFAIAFVVIADSMSFGNYNIVEMLGRYTFASFNSMQKAFDVGYNSNSELFLPNTFYYIYMVLKYMVPQLAPPAIILDGLGSDTGNIYTSLIAPYIDSGGSILVFTGCVIIYAIYIGAVNGVAINLVRKETISGYVFYAAVFACAVRSFYNPTFSYAEVLFGAVYAVILSVALPKMVTKDIGKNL